MDNRKNIPNILLKLFLPPEIDDIRYALFNVTGYTAARLILIKSRRFGHVRGPHRRSSWRLY